ncbi:hypothetical protein JRO89_XS14G0001800 [Xanthoceras sorbifolium]|uniref:FCP1 homology domain-containing protein n=1 Tax=Xanthoceras sorbifolium TaxID=99658 RepID=A0ABQ8H314_9ROSI|nr:hypothetical protein JRO89_XS14G0001800 [Xanthoceras sorbifolium]
MPALKMKAKSGTTSGKEASNLHITQKSSKISKNSCSLVRMFHESAELDTSIQNCENGGKDGTAIPEVKADDCHNWSSELSGYQVSHFPSTYISEMSLPVVIDGNCGFDDNLDNNFFSESQYAGQNLMLDMTEGFMELPALEETVEAVNTHFGRSCEELVKNSSCSWFNLVNHQIKPYDEELDVDSSRVEPDEADFDPQMFIRNFLNLSDLGSDLLPALIPNETSKRKRITLVLDLDETLVHSTTEPCENADFTFQVFFDMKEHTIYVRQRPFLRTFLERVVEMFEIIVFTASQSIYAEQLLDILDPDKNIFSQRVYRESCIFSNGSYTKDLTVLGVDLAKIAIIDNSPQVFRLQVDNGIPINSWFDDPMDSALISLIPFLETLAEADDVRPLIAQQFGTKK